MIFTDIVCSNILNPLSVKLSVVGLDANGPGVGEQGVRCC